LFLSVWPRLTEWSGRALTGILSEVKRTRPEDPPAHPAGGRRADDY
jgi:hypothetical protein